jgi:hypothetical protein
MFPNASWREFEEMEMASMPEASRANHYLPASMVGKIWVFVENIPCPISCGYGISAASMLLEKLEATFNEVGPVVQFRFVWAGRPLVCGLRLCGLT